MATGGPEGVLMGQGVKAAALKGVEEIKTAVKAANGNSKASTKAQPLAGASVSLVPVDNIRPITIAMGLVLFNSMEI